MSVSLFDQLQATLGSAYRLERELGGGGMSRVFLAHETALNRRVVVKVLLPELAAGVSVDRFRREIVLAAQLQHPHIVPLLSAGEFDGLPYFTMPFISGESLRVKLARTGELPVNEAVRILRDVVSALAYAHENGIMHRDVKPDNVLISGGVAVVTDFGVAKAVSVSTAAGAPSLTGLTSLGMALGTPNYMAPEQASGDPQIDHRADIYALGVMSYEMLAGRTPFWGRSTQQVLAAHVVEMPESIERLRPSLPPPLSALVMHCLAKRPADRPQSAAEVLQVLDAIGTPTGGIATTTVVAHSPEPARRSRSSRLRALAGGALLVALVALGFLWRRAAPPSEDVRSAPVPAPPPTSAPTPAVPVPDSVVARVPPPPDDARAPAPAVPGPVERRRPPVRQSRPARDTAPAPRPEPLPDSTPPVVAAPPPTATPAAETVTPPPAAPPPVAQPPAAQPPEASPPAPAPPQAAPQPPRDPRPEISGAIAAFASAIESRNVDNIRRVYPGMTPLQQRGWEQFFETVRDVKAQLAVGTLDVSNGAADARVSGTYAYRNNSTGRAEVQPVSFRATLRREGGGWRIIQVR